ncbi:MAG: efflux RND transporter periplasmic adaptor subunit [Acidobacteriota bacterium]
MIKTSTDNRKDQSALQKDVASHQHNKEIEYWTCSMHPFVKQSGPGKCPICGIDLTPVKRGDSAQDDSSNDAMSDSTTFTITPERQQLIGVKLTEVQPQLFEKKIRAVGSVVVDETKIVDVQPRFNGWIENVYANQTWQAVKRGDPLFTVYSARSKSCARTILLWSLVCLRHL